MKIRASYPNYQMVCRYANEGPAVFNFDVDSSDNKLEGNKPGTVIYTPQGETTMKEFPPRWYDMYRLLKYHTREREDFLQLLLAEHEKRASEAQLDRLQAIRVSFRKKIKEYVDRHPLYEDDELITPLSKKDFTDEEISHKGRMLLELTRQCYPVPDFVILTAESFKHPENLEKKLSLAIQNLEYMTDTVLGDASKPLIFAIRCAMPQYIPGLMPTLLNIGVTRVVRLALAASYDEHMANRIYLSTLHTLCEMLAIDHKIVNRETGTVMNDIDIDTKEQQRRIDDLEKRIIDSSPDGLRLLKDAHWQALCLARHVLRFFNENQDLVLTFMQGRQAFPSLILQRMVWTVGNEESYAGVLYSRNSRTGHGKQIESRRNIFGEEIMTGDVGPEECSYLERETIKETFPAVYHFDPLLAALESRHKSPVTIEFAVESRPGRLSLFSVLQLNMSELTGRAALISAIDLLRAQRISEQDVMQIIKPYHLRQIVSASIDDSSFRRLEYVGKGLSVLPRSAVSAKLCFSIAKAREMSEKGHQVCLCQMQFVPQDTITLNEVQAILSLKPAAIHVVTACRGFGIPALLDLANHGMYLKESPHAGEWQLVNEDGVVLREDDDVTISSRQGTLYKGVADFKPARFTKYLNGQQVLLTVEERLFFEEMRKAYERYQEIVTSKEALAIDNVDKLARLIRLELQDKPDAAKGLVNNWYKDHVNLYVEQVLQSTMGSHQDQSRVFNLLSNKNKVLFLRRAAEVCLAERRSGLKAGSFMLGRFTAKPLPRAVWDELETQQVAFLLNEYVLYEKYLLVLEEVGEMKLARAHSQIETEGIEGTTVSNFDLYTFVPLLYSKHAGLKGVLEALEIIDHQENTHLLIDKLSRPVGEIFDMEKPWVKEEVERRIR